MQKRVGIICMKSWKIQYFEQFLLTRKSFSHFQLFFLIKPLFYFKIPCSISQAKIFQNFLLQAVFSASKSTIFYFLKLILRFFSLDNVSFNFEFCNSIYRSSQLKSKPKSTTSATEPFLSIKTHPIGLPVVKIKTNKNKQSTKRKLRISRKLAPTQKKKNYKTKHSTYSTRHWYSNSPFDIWLMGAARSNKK